MMSRQKYSSAQSGAGDHVLDPQGWAVDPARTGRDRRNIPSRCPRRRRGNCRTVRRAGSRRCRRKSPSGSTSAADPHTGPDRGGEGRLGPPRNGAASPSLLLMAGDARVSGCCTGAGSHNVHGCATRADPPFSGEMQLTPRPRIGAPGHCRRPESRQIRRGPRRAPGCGRGLPPRDPRGPPEHSMFRRTNPAVAEWSDATADVSSVEALSTMITSNEPSSTSCAASACNGHAIRRAALYAGITMLATTRGASAMESPVFR